jgi:hypothetical protein
MRSPTRLPSVPPVQLTGGPIPLRRRVAAFLHDLVRRIAGH